MRGHMWLNKVASVLGPLIINLKQQYILEETIGLSTKSYPEYKPKITSQNYIIIINYFRYTHNIYLANKLIM